MYEKTRSHAGNLGDLSPYQSYISYDQRLNDKCGGEMKSHLPAPQVTSFQSRFIILAALKSSLIWRWGKKAKRLANLAAAAVRV